MLFLWEHTNEDGFTLQRPLGHSQNIRNTTYVTQEDTVGAIGLKRSLIDIHIYIYIYKITILIHKKDTLQMAKNKHK